MFQVGMIRVSTTTWSSTKQTTRRLEPTYDTCKLNGATPQLTDPPRSTKTQTTANTKSKCRPQCHKSNGHFAQRYTIQATSRPTLSEQLNMLIHTIACAGRTPQSGPCHTIATHPCLQPYNTKQLNNRVNKLPVRFSRAHRPSIYKISVTTNTNLFDSEPKTS